LTRADLRYILFYIAVGSLLIGACASYSATQRITVSLLLSLSLSWMFVPVLHVITAAMLVAAARAPRAGRAGAVARLLSAHAPWSIWLVTAATLTGTFGWSAYTPSLWLALIPIALTLRIVYRFVVDVLGARGRRAMALTMAHQAVTWLVAAIYLDRAVSLVPRIIGWLS
jgi:hypothetical protein